jgi:hypothetical protein
LHGAQPRSKTWDRIVRRGLQRRFEAFLAAFFAGFFAATFFFAAAFAIGILPLLSLVCSNHLEQVNYAQFHFVC